MLKQYASYFVSYLLNNLRDLENVKSVILFGSVARSDEDEGSDIDIFIDVKKKTKRFETEIKDIEKKFSFSREASLFKLKGIENEFSIKVGKLEEWEDLHDSISSTGIILYGGYQVNQLPGDLKHMVVIYWGKIGRSRGAFLNKLYGFNVHGKHYLGLLEKFNGKRLGKSCVIIPIQHKQDVFRLLREYEVEAKIVEVFNKS